MGDTRAAGQTMEALLTRFSGCGNTEIFNEMFDVRSGEWRGNMPQGLSHLALICAAQALSDTL